MNEHCRKPVYCFTYRDGADDLIRVHVCDDGTMWVRAWDGWKQRDDAVPGTRAARVTPTFPPVPEAP